MSEFVQILYNLFYEFHDLGMFLGGFFLCWIITRWNINQNVRLAENLGSLCRSKDDTIGKLLGAINQLSFTRRIPTVSFGPEIEEIPPRSDEVEAEIEAERN